MKKLFLITILLSFAFSLPLLAQTTVWNPAANANSTGLWGEAENWTAGVPTDSHKVVFNVEDAMDCKLNYATTINKLVAGDGGPGGVLHLVNGANLDISADGGWSSVGWTKEATMVVDPGAEVTFGSHMWIGFNAGSNGIVLVNGGAVNVKGMFGINFEGAGGVGSVLVNSGELNLDQLHPTQSLRGDGALLDIGEGTVNILGDHVSVISSYVDSSRITAFGGSGEVIAVYDSTADLTTVTATPQPREETTVWNPVANPFSTGKWTEALNWTDKNVPDSNKVVFNVPDAMECVLDVESNISRLVSGDNNKPGGTLRLKDGAKLNISDENWSSVGWTSTATMIVEEGAEVTFGHHLWVGFNPGAEGTIIIDGGTVNALKQTGLGWSGGLGTIRLNSGVMNCAEINPDQSIGDGSVIDITLGTLNFTGDQTGAVAGFAAADKIISYGGKGMIAMSFDSTANLTTVIGKEPERQAVTQWVPGTNPNTTGLWTEADNWSDGNVPDSNKVEFKTPGAIPCTLDAESYVSRLVMGESAPGGVLTLADGANLTVSDENWSAIGWTNTAQFIVEEGATATFGHHLWIGQAGAADAEVIIDGGTINVLKMTGIGWSGGKGKIFLNSGELNCAELNADKSIGDGSYINIEEGIINFTGDQVAAVQTYVDSAKIMGYGGGGEISIVFDSTANVTSVTSEPIPNAPVTVWNPAANPNSTGLWTEALNWTDNVVPDSNKVVFNVPGALECVMDVEGYIKKLVMGDNGVGETLRLVDGAVLTMSGDEWSAVGWNNSATLIVESGAEANFGTHLWIGFEPGSNGTVILDGGTINVTNMFGINFEAKGGKGSVLVKDGTLNLAELHPTQSLNGDSAFIDIKEGVINIVGDHVNAITDYITAGKVMAYGGAGDVVVELVGENTVVYATGPPPDITDLVPFYFKGSNQEFPWEGGSAGQGSPDGERLMYLFDNNDSTKYLVRAVESWIDVYTAQLSNVTQYTIVSANDAPERDPKAWDLQGWDTETNEWVTIHSVTDNPSWPDFYTPKTWEFENDSWYSTYRLNITAINDDPQNLMQIGELSIFGQLADSVEIITPEGPIGDITDVAGCEFVGSNDDEPWDGGNGSPDAERLPMLFDNDVFTKYLVRAEVSWIDVYTPKLSQVKSYTITSANDAPTRDPRSWEFQGLDTETGQWVTLDTVNTNPSWPDFFTPLTWNMPNNTKWCSSYRLNILGLNEDPQGLMQIAEFDIYGIIGEDVELQYPSEVAIDDEEKTALTYSLSQNYPNPFNPTTTITYAIPEIAKVQLTIYNILGQKVTQLVNQNKEAGRYQVIWDAQNAPSGLYFVTFKANSKVFTKKMMLLK